MAALSLLKASVFWNKGYNVIISVKDTINKISSPDSNYIVDAVMWPKFFNSSISTREVITTSISQGLTKKTNLFDCCSCFKFNDLGLPIGMDLKVYTNVTKWVKIIVKNVWEVVGSLFAPPYSEWSLFNYITNLWIYLKMLPVV